MAHVEAGLRTENKYSPFPEEINRRMTSVIAEYHFPPTNLSERHLLDEGIKSKSIFVTGNTVIDALMYISSKLDHNSEKQKNLGLLLNQNDLSFNESFDKQNIQYSCCLYSTKHKNKLIDNFQKQLNEDICNEVTKF